MEETPPVTPTIDGAADIYGDDNRQEPSEAAEMFQRRAEDTALVTTRNMLSLGPGDVWYLSALTLTEKVRSGYGAPLCDSERFRHEPAPGLCSAFLIAPRLVATAGHCINMDYSCGDLRFIFGFANGDGQDVTRVEEDDFYMCASVVGHLFDQDAVTEDDMVSLRLWSDWAVVMLDRPVVGRTPIPLRRTGQPETGDLVAALGYPSGVPLKITSGYVMDDDPELYFNTDLDIYRGNSGSVVVSEDDVAEGIVIRGTGGTSFERRGDCFVSEECESWDPSLQGCTGNHVMRIDPVLQFVDAERIVRQGATPSGDAATIPDGSSAFEGEIEISDGGSIAFVTLNVGVSHSRPQDLRISLERAETGHRAVLFERPTLRRAGNPTFSQTASDFDGELAAGMWRIVVEDLEPGGGSRAGTVFFYQLVVGIGEHAQPSAGATFVGSPCAVDDDCGFDPSARCHTFGDLGFCTVACEGYCPDRTGFASTFCVSLDGGASGSCVPRAHHRNGNCGDVPGASAQLADRFVGQSNAAETSETVCIP